MNVSLAVPTNYGNGKQFIIRKPINYMVLSSPACPVGIYNTIYSRAYSIRAPLTALLYFKLSIIYYISEYIRMSALRINIYECVQIQKI